MLIDNFHAITDSLVSIGLLAAGGFFISNNMKYYLPRSEKFWYILVLSITVAFFWFLAARAVMWMILKDGDPYLTFIRSSAITRFGAGFLILSSMSMFSLMWYGQQEYKELVN